jgi:sporulation protein YlmC with PRC-barrel domain
MNRQNRILFSALALAFAGGVCGTVWAQGAQGAGAGTTTTTPPQATAPAPSADTGAPSPGTPLSQGAATPGMAQANAMLNMKAGEIAGREVYNTQGKELGKVDMIGRDRATGALSAVISVGGFLGFGGSKVAIPIEQLSFQDDKLILSTAMSKKELRQQATGYQSKRYEAVAEDTTLSQVAPPTMGASAGSAPPVQGTQTQGTGATASFQQLDANRDGYITRSEASHDSTLMSHWRELDRNNDGRIDNSEFSAFEQSSTEPRPSGDNMREREGAKSMPQQQ